MLLPAFVGAPRFPLATLRLDWHRRLLFLPGLPARPRALRGGFLLPGGSACISVSEVRLGLKGLAPESFGLSDEALAFGLLSADPVAEVSHFTDQLLAARVLSNNALLEM